jgi:hypothetical protein
MHVLNRELVLLWMEQIKAEYRSLHPCATGTLPYSYFCSVYHFLEVVMNDTRESHFKCEQYLSEQAGECTMDRLTEWMEKLTGAECENATLNMVRGIRKERKRVEESIRAIYKLKSEVDSTNSNTVQDVTLDTLVHMFPDVMCGVSAADMQRYNSMVGDVLKQHLSGVSDEAL